jgi:hypothetical protein
MGKGEKNNRFSRKWKWWGLLCGDGWWLRPGENFLPINPPTTNKQPPAHQVFLPITAPPSKAF